MPYDGMIISDERKSVRERYKEYDGCYLGHYAQWFFFTLGICMFASMIAVTVVKR